MKTLVIEWQRLLDEEKETCPRCGSTEQEVEKAVRDLKRMLATSDVDVTLVKKAIDPKTFKKDALQSNKILIAGRTLEEWLGATTGQSKCCDVCGDSDCRTVEYGGEVHEAIPAELIVRAGITAAAHLFKIQPPQTSHRIPVIKLQKDVSSDQGGMGIVDQDKPETDEKQQSGECCPPSSEPISLSCGSKDINCCGSSHRSRSKTIIFVLVVLAALAAGAYSMYKRNAPHTTNPCYGVSLRTIDAIGAPAAGKQAIFFFLFGADKDQSQNLSLIVEKSVKTLSGNGKRVAAFTLYRDEEGFNELQEKLSINSFPCVVVVGRSCSPVVISKGDITENNLAYAFAQASYGCAAPCK